MSTITKKNNGRGFTIIETLFYAVGLVILLGAMSTFLFFMSGWYRNATIGPRVDTVGTNLIDRITKEVRSGRNVIQGSSVLNSATGTLAVSAFVSGALIEKDIIMTNGSGKVSFRQNGGPTQDLTPPDLSVTKLYFTASTTSVSQAVKFDVDISFWTKENGTTTKSFSGFAILRQSYDQ